MDQIDEIKVENRDLAGKMLAQKFVRNHFLNPLVVGASAGGMVVAEAIADRLHIPLEVTFCKRIEDPSDSSKSIGSVSANEVILHDCPRSVPQDYLYFQTIRLRNEMKYDNEFYYGDDNYPSFEGKTVILVDDMLTTPDTLLACLTEIRRTALKVIVAVPFVEAEAARRIQSLCDDFLFIRMKQRINSPAEFYNEFPEVSPWEVRSLLREQKMDLVEI